MNYITAFGIKFTGPKVTTLQFLYELYKRSKQIVTKMDCELFSFLDECKVACWKDLQSIGILHNPAFENNIYESYENEYRLALNFKVNTNFKIRNELEKLSKLLKNPEFQATFPENESATYTLILSEYNVTKDELYTNTQIIETCTDGYSFEPLSPGEYTVKFTKNKQGEIITNTNHGSTERENKDIDELINKRFIEVGELLSVDWFLANYAELTKRWQNDEKTKINREALKYHGIDASDDEVYLSFFEAIRSIKDGRNLLFSSLYTMLLTTPSGKDAYQQYVKDLFETKLMLNAPETLKCLNDMTRKFNCLDDNLSTTT